jgi:ribonuclease Y
LFVLDGIEVGVGSEALAIAVPILLGALGGLLALGLSVATARRITRRAKDAARRVRAESRADADARAKEITVAAQEKLLALGDEADQREREIEARESSIEARAAELERDASALGRRRADLERREGELSRAERALQESRKAADSELESARRNLERIAGMSAAEARAELVTGIEREARKEGSRLARKIQDEAREQAERDAAQLVVQATQRINTKRAVETTVSFIELPNDEMKGRIIGREGRNIRALETATGIDLIVDDTPRSILISSFDPVRREIARIAIERLIEDGRIHPARIEEVVERVRSEIDGLIEESGSQAAFELGVTDLHTRLNRLVGWMKLRTIHGQNLLQHCVEVGLIAGHMASEIGARADLVRRAGLLHEVGRVEPDVAGPAVLASGDIAGRYGETEEVVHAIQGLHRDVEAATVEALLLQAANRISVARPGARKENLEIFIERLRRLEEISASHTGVEKAYAVKAGKELRVIVDAASVSDQDAYALSRKIARALEKDLSFQGKIKVSVVRETRAVHFAV